MAYQAINIARSKLCSSISFPCRDPLICSTFKHGATSYPLYPVCYPCLCFSRKKLKALSVSNKLTGSEKGLNPPPSSKEEAIQQVRECLSNLLEKPLKNLGTSVKQKRQRQARLRVEIPIIDDSLSALTSLVVDTLAGFSVKRKGLPTKFVILWPNSSQTDLACRSFENADCVKNLDVSNQDMEFVEDSDVLFFVAPAISQLPFVESISKAAAPRPVVLFNPNWSFEDESNASGFLSSFEAAYSFTPLAIQGFFSKTEGAIFKHVRSGAPSSTPWLIFVKEKGKYREKAFNPLPYKGGFAHVSPPVTQGDGAYNKAERCSEDVFSSKYVFSDSFLLEVLLIMIKEHIFLAKRRLQNTWWGVPRLQGLIGMHLPSPTPVLAYPALEARPLCSRAQMINNLWLTLNSVLSKNHANWSWAWITYSFCGLFHFS